MNRYARLGSLALMGLGLMGLGLLGACSKQSAPSTTADITGTLNYREPFNFETDAQLQLQLTDVSAEGPAVEAASVTINNLRALPYQYTLAYDPKRIDSTHRYTISARIYSGKQLKFATDTALAVLTQGNSTHADIPVIAAGTNESGAVANAAASSSTGDSDIFQGDLRSGNEVALYRAEFIDNHIAWLEEDRTNGTPQPLHARYEFKGALLLHYSDSTGFEFACNENGRPISVSRNKQVLVVTQETTAINAARNRAALLRSHALTSREIKAHRLATKQDVGG
jgi:putative lipoprotein